MAMSIAKARSSAPILLVSVLLLSPVMAWPNTGAWLGMRAFVLQCAAFALLALLLSRLEWNPQGILRFLATGPNLPILLLVGWATLSFFLTAPESGPGRNIALTELMRLVSGAAVYFGVAYLCNSRARLKAMVLALLLGGLAAALAGIWTYTRGDGGVATGAFGNSQLLAAYLCVLLPVAAVFSLSGAMDARRILASVAVVFIACALLLTKNRGAWIAITVGMVVVSTLALRGTPWREILRRKHLWLAPVVAAVGSLGLFFMMGRADPVLADRGRSLSSPAADPSLQWRLHMWGICEQIIRSHPINGAGIGSFPLVANGYDATAQPPNIFSNEKLRIAVSVDGRRYSAFIPSRESVLKNGVSLSSLPHNQYAHLGAELGLFGVLLWILILVFTLAPLRRQLRVTPIGTTTLTALAAVGAIITQSIDGTANPAWHLPALSTLTWLFLGIAVAIPRINTSTRASISSTQHTRTLPEHISLTRAIAYTLTFTFISLIIPQASASTKTEQYLSANSASFTYHASEHRTIPVSVNVTVKRANMVPIGTTSVTVKATLSNANPQGQVAFTLVNDTVTLTPSVLGTNFNFSINMTPTTAVQVSVDVTFSCSGTDINKTTTITLTGTLVGGTKGLGTSKGQLKFKTDGTLSQLRSLLLFIEGGQESSTVTGTLRTTGGPFAVLKDSFKVRKGEKAMVTVRFSPTVPGTYFGTLIIESDDRTRLVIFIPLEGLAGAQ